MAHIGRTVKNAEAPRPLKSQSRSSMKNNYMLIEELIQLIENVALTLQSGTNNTEPMASLVQNLRIHGPQLESVSKDTLDRAFVVFRNASQDERLNIMTRLNLLELIELRAKGWEDNGFNSYYKTKQATNAELPDGQQHHVDAVQTAFLSTSPTFGGAGGAAAAAAAAAIAAVGSAQQQHMLLGPGEVIRNSGKFPKPTKIPGKTYCKDEVVIRNADSGKVMGIKGRRVHMIEELSETIISFQRVNPGAKERLVQITGPTEEKINYAKHLIEDTIRRNASPVRLDPAMGGALAGGGSCSSLASSNSDEATPRTPGGGSNIANRLSFNSAQNFMTASAAAQQAAILAAQQQQHHHQQQQQHQQHVAHSNMMSAVAASSTPSSNTAAAAGKVLMRPSHQMLLHSFSTNDASLGEYKYTVNVGQHLIKITGDCCDLVRVAKLVLDDYFSSAEFLASVEAGAGFDGSMPSPISTPSTPQMGPPQFMMGPLQAAPPLADSGIGLNYIGQLSNSGAPDGGDDEVFIDANGLATSSSQNNGLARSRRSHFSRKDSMPEAAINAAAARNNKSDSGAAGTLIDDSSRIVHQYEHLLYYAKSKHSWALPVEWQKICEKFPAIIRNKVTQTHATTTGTPPPQPPSPTFTTTTTTTVAQHSIFSSLSSANTPSPTNALHSWRSSSSTNDNGAGLNSVATSALNIKRKGFFNRQTYSIDEEGYTAMQQSQTPTKHFDNYDRAAAASVAAVGQGISVALSVNGNNNTNVTSCTTTVIQSNLDKEHPIHLCSIRTGPTTSSPCTLTQAQVVANNAHNRQQLLNKQINIISAILESRRQPEPAAQQTKLTEGLHADEDDDSVEFIAETKYQVNDDAIDVARPKFAREYRSNSTCD